MTNAGLSAAAGVVAAAAIALAGCIDGSGGGGGNGNSRGDDMIDESDRAPLPDGDTANGDGNDVGGSRGDGPFTITVLGNLPFLSGPPFEDHPVTTHATDINNAGQVVGWSTSGWGQGDGHGVLWTDGNVLNIQHSQWTSLHGINEQGQIVGSAGSSATVSLKAFPWQHGSIMDIGDVPAYGGNVSSALAINSKSQVVGWAVDDPWASSRSRRAFLWQNGHLVDLGSLPGGEDTSSAHAINAQGQVVGASSVAFPGFIPTADASRAFLWENDEMIDLGLATGHAVDINDRGQIVGTGKLDGEQRAFLWREGEVVNLGTLPGGHSSRASAINEAGQVVGVSESESGPRAFLWEQGGGMRDLNDLIHPGDPHHGAFVFEKAPAINDQGQIVTVGRIDGDEHALVLTPVEPD